MGFGKAKKKELNRQVKLAKKIEEVKAREDIIANMEDDKTYFSKYYNLELTGKQWKELLKEKDESK